MKLQRNIAIACVGTVLLLIIVLTITGCRPATPATGTCVDWAPTSADYETMYHTSTGAWRDNETKKLVGYSWGADTTIRVCAPDCKLVNQPADYGGQPKLDLWADTYQAVYYKNSRWYADNYGDIPVTLGYSSTRYSSIWNLRTCIV